MRLLPVFNKLNYKTSINKKNQIKRKKVYNLVKDIKTFQNKP